MELSKNPVAEVLLRQSLYNLTHHSERITKDGGNLSDYMLKYHIDRLQAAIETWQLGRKLNNFNKLEGDKLGKLEN